MVVKALANPHGVAYTFFGITLSFSEYLCLTFLLVSPGTGFRFEHGSMKQILTKQEPTKPPLQSIFFCSTAKGAGVLKKGGETGQMVLAFNSTTAQGVLLAQQAKASSPAGIATGAGKGLRPQVQGTKT